MSNLEQQFAGLWNRFGCGVDPVREYVFAKPRRFRFDFAWPEKKVAVEIEGGQWVNGAHNRGAHFQSDADIYNLAVMQGWRVLRYTVVDLRQRPLQVVAEVEAVLSGSGQERRTL